MAQNESVIARTFRDYVQAFQTLKPQALLRFCHVPCVFIAPQGVLVMASSAEIETFFTQVMENLNARSYARSELTDLQMNRMSQHTALVSVGRIRYKTDGQELERLGNLHASQYRRRLEDCGGNDS